MTAKPLIGISGSHMIDGGGQFPGYHRSYVNHDYVRSVTEAGGIPLIIPFNEEDDVVEALWTASMGSFVGRTRCVSPPLWGRTLSADWRGVAGTRSFRHAAFEAGGSTEIPVVGICRGLQIINVAHGGTLYQDLSKDPQSFVKHSQNQDPATATHTIEIDPQSRLASLLGRTEWVTNSIITRPFTKWAKDSLLQPAPRMAPWNPCKTGESYLMAYQFHPE